MLPPRQWRSVWIPVSIALIIVLLSGLIARQIHESEIAAVEERSRAALREVSYEFERRMEAKVRALERLAGRWEYDGALTEADFEAAADDAPSVWRARSCQYADDLSLATLLPITS